MNKDLKIKPAFTFAEVFQLTVGIGISTNQGFL